ncbi:hypothetical protein [Streptomyces sp. NPDC051561]|uniref:hypothetical protein n=1 Tax=Streptomyces sp. NPDC051561 TaxID=3365658 RepID=UPI0037A9DF4E
MRLSDLYRGELSWRELGVLVRQLPAGARTRRALGDTDSMWGLGEHLQAAVIDELRVANWQRANSGLKAHEQSKPPEPVERPGNRTQQRRKITADDLLAHRERTRLHAVA